MLLGNNMLYSLTVDNQQLLRITSSSFEMDYQQGYALYNGQVTLNQGTRSLTSDQLYVYFDSKTKDTPDTPAETIQPHFQNIQSNDNNIKETNKIKEIKALGINTPVTYSEQLQKQEGKLSAKASIMKFSPKESLLTLEKQALIEQNGRRLTSELLHYNTKTEVAYTPKLKNQRTKVILG
jgi:lipopolysaccharide transport protein LptA